MSNYCSLIIGSCILSFHSVRETLSQEFSRQGLFWCSKQWDPMCWSLVSYHRFSSSIKYFHQGIFLWIPKTLKIFVWLERWSRLLMKRIGFGASTHVVTQNSLWLQLSRIGCPYLPLYIWGMCMVHSHTCSQNSESHKMKLINLNNCSFVNKIFKKAF